MSAVIFYEVFPLMRYIFFHHILWSLILKTLFIIFIYYFEVCLYVPKNWFTRFSITSKSKWMDQHFNNMIIWFWLDQINLKLLLTIFLFKFREKNIINKITVVLMTILQLFYMDDEQRSMSERNHKSTNNIYNCIYNYILKSIMKLFLNLILN